MEINNQDNSQQQEPSAEDKSIFKAFEDRKRAMDFLTYQNLACPENPLEDLELAYPRANETIVGTLTYEEASIYHNYSEAVAELQEVCSETNATALRDLADALEQNKTFSLEESNISEDTIYEYFRARRKVQFLKEWFFWKVGERLGLHDYVLGVRNDWKISRGERKY